jgi:RHS repeat-associated protein
MVKPNAQGTEVVLVARYDYDVYGAVRTQSGSSSNKFKYVAGIGHPTDEETGLIYMRARYYEPSVGRFVSEDPGLEGTNWYAYVMDNPTNAVDPTGLGFIRWIKNVLRAAMLGRDIRRLKPRPPELQTDDPPITIDLTEELARRRKGGPPRGGGGGLGIGLTTVDAYAMANPDDFIELLKDLAGGYDNMADNLAEGYAYVEDDSPA